MSKYHEIKEELKTLAKQIKKYKLEYKEAQRKNKFNSIWDIEKDVRESVYQFRHRHIAMSIIRGRERDEIERPGDDNLPNEYYIKELVDIYEKELAEEYEQALRINASRFARFSRGCSSRACSS